MDKLIRLIEGNDGISVEMGVSIYINVIEEKELTVDLYSLHHNNLMRFRFIEGFKVGVKLFNSLDVESKVDEISNEDNFKVHYV